MTRRLSSALIVFFYLLGMPETHATNLKPSSTKSLQQETQKGDPAKSQTPPKEEITFKLTMMADGFYSDDCTFFHADSYATSNGEKAGVLWARFDSVKEATARLQKDLKMATKVIERGPRTDSHGVVVGERILAILEFDVPQEPVELSPCTKKNIVEPEPQTKKKVPTSETDPNSRSPIQKTETTSKANKHKTVYAVIWADGIVYRQFSADSLEVVLALEKWPRPW